MDKQNVVYTYKEVIFNLKKEGNANSFYNVKERWRPHAEWNEPEKRKIEYDSVSMIYPE